jgi:hypothetical protein
MKSLRVGLILVAIGGLTILVAALVMAAPGSFLRESVVRPLSYALWIVSLLLRGTPQVIFWGFLLLVALVVALRSIAAVSRQPVHPQPILVNYPHRARLRFWVRQLLLSQDDRVKFQLKEALNRLAMDVLAYQQGLTPGQYQQQLDRSEKEAPEELVPFLNARQSMYATRPPLSLQQVRQWIERTIDSLPVFSNPQPVKDAEVERLVDYLEERMDME